MFLNSHPSSNNHLAHRCGGLQTFHGYFLILDQLWPPILKWPLCLLLRTVSCIMASHYLLYALANGSVGLITFWKKQHVEIYCLRSYFNRRRLFCSMGQLTIVKRSFKQNTKVYHLNAVKITTNRAAPVKQFYIIRLHFVSSHFIFYIASSTLFRHLKMIRTVLAYEKENCVLNVFPHPNKKKAKKWHQSRIILTLYTKNICTYK